jgi:hypothetical protein
MKARLTESEPFVRYAGRPLADLRRAVRIGVTAGTNGLKLEFRQMVGRAFGERLANAIGSEVYPKDGRPSLGTAGEVFARGEGAEKIFKAFSEGVPIRAAGGGWLALPVAENMPVLGRGVPKSPRAVEAYFGRPLRYVPPKVIGAGADLALLVLDRVVKARGKGVKNATRRRVAQSREVKSVVMFILVPVVHPGKRLDFDKLARIWSARMPDLIDQAFPGN